MLIFSRWFMGWRKVIASIQGILSSHIGLGNGQNRWSWQASRCHCVLYLGHGVFTLAFILGAIMLTCCVRRVISTEEVEMMIKAQVPIGSERQQVKDFIGNMKVESLKIGRDDFHEADPRALGNRDPDKIAELGDRIAEFAGAVIYHAQSDGFWTFDNIVMQFYLDKDGRMIGYTVKLVGAD